MATRSQLAGIEAASAEAIYAIAQQQAALCADPEEEAKAFDGMLWSLFRLKVARSMAAGDSLRMASRRSKEWLAMKSTELWLNSDLDARKEDRNYDGR